MKVPLLFVLLFLALQSFSQSNKFTFGVEYAPAVTNVTQDYRNLYPTGLWPVNNLFLRSGFSISPKFDLTGGLGLMTAREFEYMELNSADFESIKIHRFHKYIVAPVGFKYKFGSFFINPEIGIGFNFSNTNKSELVFTNGTSSSAKVEDHYYQVNEITYPVSLGFGNEIKMNFCSVTMGIRGYYGLNPVSSFYGPYSGHYYGFGVFGGVSF